MSESASSYRQILKTSMLIAGASVINLVIGMIRTKLVALLLGPSGIGLISLYSGLMSTAAAVTSMGIGMTGTRQVAESLGKKNDQELSIVRRAIFFGVLILASSGALVIWSLREVLAVLIMGSSAYASNVGWLALGVALAAMSASQGAVIQGMRRISDMAKLSVYSSLWNTIIGTFLLWQLGESGLIAFVLVGPIASFVLGRWYVARLPELVYSSVEIQDIFIKWKILIRLGVPFMAAGLVGAVVQLWIRVEVGNTLGAEALGYFQAAWVISMQYIGLVLAAMGADFYPRLTSIINDESAAIMLVNEQTEVALLLSAPVFIGIIGLAPWVINLLYSSEFYPAVEILRWQVLGDVLKVASWPLGFIILAAGDSKTFFWVETFIFMLMGTLIAGLSAIVGLKITGIAFLLSYAALLPLLYWLVRRRIGFYWFPHVRNLLVFVFGLCIVVYVVCVYYWWGRILAIIFMLVFSIYTIARLGRVSNPSGHIGKLSIAVIEISKRLSKKIFKSSSWQ